MRAWRNWYTQPTLNRRASKHCGFESRRSQLQCDTLTLKYKTKIKLNKVIDIISKSYHIVAVAVKSAILVSVLDRSD